MIALVKVYFMLLIYAELLQQQTLYVLSTLRISSIVFIQSFTVVLCVSAHIWPLCECMGVLRACVCYKFSPRNGLRPLRVIYVLLVPSLRARHQSEPSTPSLHLSPATFYLAQQVA